jgi:hypothetical protein
MQQAQGTTFAPRAETVERAQLGGFIRYCALRTGYSFGDYADFDVVLIPSGHLGLVQVPAVRQLVLALDRCLHRNRLRRSPRSALPGRQLAPAFDPSAVPDNPGARLVSEQRD